MPILQAFKSLRQVSYIISYRIAWDTESLREIKMGWKVCALRL